MVKNIDDSSNDKVYVVSVKQFGNKKFAMKVLPYVGNSTENFIGG